MKTMENITCFSMTQRIISMLYSQFSDMGSFIASNSFRISMLYSQQQNVRITVSITFAKKYSLKYTKFNSIKKYDKGRRMSVETIFYPIVIKEQSASTFDAILAILPETWLNLE